VTMSPTEKDTLTKEKITGGEGSLREMEKRQTKGEDRTMDSGIEAGRETKEGVNEPDWEGTKTCTLSARC